MGGMWARPATLLIAQLSLAQPSAVCWASAGSVGMLLRRQLKLLRRGQTYLESLAAEEQREERRMQQQAGRGDASAPPSGAAAAAAAGDRAAADDTSQGTHLHDWRGALRSVFGDSRHPLTWLLPAWDDVPPGGGGACLPRQQQRVKAS